MITTIVRTFILYIFVTLGIRLMGKRQIGDMQPNELVVTLLISEIAAIPLQDANQPILNGVVAIFILVIIEIIISFLSMKSIYLRRIMNGRSIVIIKNGKVDIAVKRDGEKVLLKDVTFETEEALAGYQVNPLHVEAASYVRSVVEARLCLDF